MNTITLNPAATSKLVFSLKFISFKKFLILSSLITAALLIFYIFQINAEASERYLIKNYEIKLSQAIREKQALEINLVESNSLDNIINKVLGLDFEKIEKIDYIRISGDQILAR